MVRNYKKKNIRGNWNVEHLHEAVQNIKNGSISLMDASRQYEIPATTLRDHVKNRIRNSSNVPAVPKKVGRKTVFTEEQELQLEKYCIEMSTNIARIG